MKKLFDSLDCCMQYIAEHDELICSFAVLIAMIILSVWYFG